MNSPRFRFDENVEPLVVTALWRANLRVRAARIGDEGVPSLGSPDPDILEFCDESDWLLFTRERRTMITHVHTHIASGGHLPGVFILDPGMSVLDLVDDILLLNELYEREEWQDRVWFLPV